MTLPRSGDPRTQGRRAQPLIRVPGPDRTRPDMNPAAAMAISAGRIALFYVIAPVVLLALIAATFGYVWLTYSSVPLKSFSSQIERRINKTLVGLKAEIGDAKLTVGDDKGIELRLTNLRLKEPDGDAVVTAPQAAVKFDPSALWRLDAAPERIYLIEPKLAVAYSEEGGLSLSIGNGDTDPAAAAAPAGPAPRAAAAPGAFRQINVAKLLADASARARQSNEDEFSLRKFGVIDAKVTFTDGRTSSELKVAQASIDLEHTANHSVISGSATVETGEQPWDLEFRIEESGNASGIVATAKVENLVPSSFARISPRLALFEILSMPVTGELKLDLSTAGELVASDLDLDIGRGEVRLPSVSNTPMLLESGALKIHYTAEARRLTLKPSTLNWADSHIVLQGTIASDPPSDGPPQWRFDIQSVEGALSSGEFNVSPIPIESFVASGRVIPAEGLVQLSEFVLKAGGGAVTANGEVINGAGQSSTRLEAAMTPMPLATLKALWPRAAAAAARKWVGEQVTHANLQGASLKVLSGRFLEGANDAEASAGAGRERISASIDITDLRMSPLPRSLPLEAPRAVIRLENSTLEVNVPEAAIVASPEHRLPLTGVRLTVVDLRHDAPIAELALKSKTTLPVLIETLNRSQLHLAGQGPLPIEGVEGKVDGELKIGMPLVNDASVVRATGKARISDIKGKSKDYHVDLNGGTIDVDVSEAGVIAKGDLIVNGVVTKLQMHRLLEAPPEAQPPTKLTATLDNADRNQLGLDVNHFVQGTMPLDVTITHRSEGPPMVHVRADLTKAELLFQGVSWKKPPGRPASLDFDVSPSETAGHMDLRNFKLVGDNIAIDGWAVMDDKRDVTEFSFPNFSINVVSRLAVSGKMSDKRIWSINAQGSTFDARDVFRSMLAFSGKDEEIKPRNPAAGVDFNAQIDTLIGHSEVSLRNAKLKYSSRGEKTVAVEADGVLDGDQLFMMELKPGGRRLVYAKSGDAGQTLKMIGLYPNIKGGRMELDIDVDGQGAAEMNGTLTIDNFRVLGDPIVSEVYSSAEGQGAAKPAARPKQNGERQVFEFQRMQVPFSIGHGQFVLDDSYLRGPLLGASIRGRVDFNARRVNLGGTYVPLQGINAAVCDIPLFGPIVAGFDCQGVFGITYAIQGSMDGSGPEVIVNPLSMFTPGILRGIMELTSPNPQVRPLSGPQKAPAEGRVRASSSTPSGVVDGWSSETQQGESKKKR